MQSVVILPVTQITDWDTFHSVFKHVFGFPDFYGRNMDAWIDCMTSLDAPDDGLTSIWVKSGELLAIRVDSAFEFKQRCPDQYDALVECSAS